MKAIETIGQKLILRARAQIAPVRLTEHYWGSTFYRDGGKYYVRHYKQGWGGMKSMAVQVLARDVKSCTSLVELQDLLQPSCDLAPGDPMHYTPRNVQSVELVNFWEES